VFQAAEPRSTQVETGTDSSTGLFCPATEGSKLGDNTLAFSTCCQNCSELIGGCLRINSNKASRFVVISLTIHRDGLASKLNSPPLPNTDANPELRLLLLAHCHLSAD
jgi:hypothetical protein